MKCSLSYLREETSNCVNCYQTKQQQWTTNSHIRDQNPQQQAQAPYIARAAQKQCRGYGQKSEQPTTSQHKPVGYRMERMNGNHGPNHVFLAHGSQPALSLYQKEE